MPVPILMIDGLTGTVALFDEAPYVDGLPADYTRNDPRNRPLLDPENWFENVYFSSELDNMEVSHALTIANGLARTIVHKKVKKQKKLDQTGMEAVGKLLYGAYRLDTLLLTHNLKDSAGVPYIPWFKVVTGVNTVTPAFPVQVLPDGATRYVSVWANKTEIWLSEFVNAGNVAPPAITVTYEILVFRKPPAPSRDGAGRIYPAYDNTGGLVSMAGGRWRSDRNYLQVVPGGSPFRIPAGRTMDAKNGAPRFVAADKTIYDPVQAFQPRLHSAAKLPKSLKYNGSFTGADAILVQTP